MEAVHKLPGYAICFNNDGVGATGTITGEGGRPRGAAEKKKQNGLDQRKGSKKETL